MVREGCLPIRGSEMMAWKYDDDCCRCVQVKKRGTWRGAIRIKVGMHKYVVIKGYQLESDKIEKEIMRFLD